MSRTNQTTKNIYESKYTEKMRKTERIRATMSISIDPDLAKTLNRLKFEGRYTSRSQLVEELLFQAIEMESNEEFSERLKKEYLGLFKKVVDEMFLEFSDWTLRNVKNEEAYNTWTEYLNAKHKKVSDTVEEKFYNHIENNFLKFQQNVI